MKINIYYLRNFKRMNLIARISLIFILFIIPDNNCSSQICNRFHENCIFADWEFFYSRQSASALFEPNQTSSMRFFAKAHEKYYISVCGSIKLKDIKFRILEEGANGIVIYDNSLDHFSYSITFINENSRNLIIEITAPDVKSKNEGAVEKFCIGVLIQFQEMNENLPEDGATGFKQSNQGDN